MSFLTHHSLLIIVNIFFCFDRSLFIQYCVVGFTYMLVNFVSLNKFLGRVSMSLPSKYLDRRPSKSLIQTAN